ncbi:ZIP family metal transporter [Cognatilysobacter bugurensis]|uniref:ZIP family metal transporter n=1 Tax=Cognatilysobacter bugurensis TaxID=543356 RepID=A0A918W840_9GAMM|nr:ZIP family metal transporter [Lysobacter bugurensis]GHA79607.1 ZIP family metal transporter [Lysobacter bugurensis]
MLSAAAGLPPTQAALLGGTLAALMTTLGALPALFIAKLGARTNDALLGFGAGVMLAASAFSLVLPGIEAAEAQGWAPFPAGGLVGVALLAGAALLLWMERSIPHEHFIKGAEGRSGQNLKRTWLFVFAIALHNVPEGLAIGVAFANNFGQGAALATGIAVQDIPEGLVVAVALITAGYTRGTAVLVAAMSGVVEPIGALIGAAVVTALPLLLPVGLGIAAGAMLYVVSHEIIPESHRQGHEHWATSGLMVGFVLMTLLDTALG